MQRAHHQCHQFMFWKRRPYHPVLFFLQEMSVRCWSNFTTYQTLSNCQTIHAQESFLGPRNSAATRCSAERCGNHATPGSKRLDWLCQGFKMNSMVQRCICIYIYIYIFFQHIYIYIYIHITVIIETHPYLVGGWALPLWKYESQLGWLFPTEWNNKNVPNHQPYIYIYIYMSHLCQPPYPPSTIESVDIYIYIYISWSI